MQTKIALITGGSRGLGKSSALHLAAAGHDIMLTYRTGQQEAETVVAEIRNMGRTAIALPYDAEDMASLDTFVQLVKQDLKTYWNTDRFDFLILNAGMGATIPFDKATEADFDRFCNVHFKSVYFLAQRLLPAMNDQGRIITLSSGTTRFCNPGYSIYASMKGAVEVFTRYLAQEAGSRGITANILAPGPIETDFNNAAIRNNPNLKSLLAGRAVLGRVGEADDIGRIMALLCSPESQWITGQRIEASGGINL